MSRLTTVRAAVVTKADERYVIIYDDEHYWDARKKIWTWAAHPDLSLTWWDAAGWVERMKEKHAKD